MSAIILCSLSDFQLHTDSTCVLLPPRCLDPLPSNVIDRISAALATRFNVRKAIAKQHVPHQIEQWGKVRRMEGGDTMVSILLGKSHLDRRDATHVRVRRPYQRNSLLIML